MPKMQLVDSSSIESIGYAASRQELYVRFRESGEIYVYFDVAPAVFERFSNATSKGRFLNEHVKDDYDYVKL